MLASADPYRHMAKARAGQPQHVQLAALLEERAAEAYHQQLREAAITEALRDVTHAVALDVGCGTGPFCRALSSRPQVAKVLGVDPCATFIDEARRLSSNPQKESYVCGRASAVPLGDHGADLVIFWTVLLHLHPDDVNSALQEARRVLRPGGRVLLGDNDMGRWTIADAAHDPLHAPLQFYIDSFVAEPDLARRFPELLCGIGLQPGELEVSSVIDRTATSYGCRHVMLRAIEAFKLADKVGDQLIEAMKHEVQRRLAADNFQITLSYAFCVGSDLNRAAANSEPNPSSDQDDINEVVFGML
ncbi:hypothetical protein AB1Y20_017725 [Prymnesium parvum]|uniref:Methyltransferase type 11 domain-containing protein n=1 Tax=Prymnesium parvum TaxID=97485 RepID=A0AB34JM22_PRYPA